ncbi:MAG: hypothetical protein HC819_13485 [Cyclobacteriaceae bacterium]|nr:hypothetical protein [Cyclobacteriaceae bacterium]
MNAKYILAAVLICSTTTLFAQSRFNKQYSFDKERFHQRLENHQIAKLNDTTLPGQETAGQMPVFHPNKHNMSKMPKMSIRRDINYAMRIKKYDLYYPFTGKIDELHRLDQVVPSPLRLK